MCGPSGGQIPGRERGKAWEGGREGKGWVREGILRHFCKLHVMLKLCVTIKLNAEMM